MSNDPDSERIRFAKTVRLLLDGFAGERLVVHVRRMHAADWALAVITKADGSSAFTLGRGISHGTGPGSITLDSLSWPRPRYFDFYPRTRQALIDWLQTEVERHNQEVSKDD